MNTPHGHLYVAGWPPTQSGFQSYGKQRPPYIGFVWENESWKRLPFADLPEVMPPNLLIDGIPPAGTKLLQLSRKERAELNNLSGFGKGQQQIDPTYRSSFH
jgi:hypothetical protein